MKDYSEMLIELYMTKENACSLLAFDPLVIKINVRGVVVMKILAVIAHVTFVDIIGRWSRDWHAFTWSSVV